MLNEIKSKIEKEIIIYIEKIDKQYSLSVLSPTLLEHIKKFMLQGGKRLRPMLFIISYLGYSKKVAPGLYTSALSLEFLHNFLLVHDDIIDKSNRRRNGLSMHAMLNKKLQKYSNVKCSGQDLAIVTGDIMCALGISTFLEVKEDPVNKGKALKKMMESAVHTGIGEFLELFLETKKLSSVTKEDIYKIYELKTAIYSFSAPLVIGALLAGAKETEVDKLFECGLHLGRAFQIKNDLADIFDTTGNTNEFSLEDLREGKRTILIWYAYNNSGDKEKITVKRILEKQNSSYGELLELRKIIIDSGAIDYAKSEINKLANKAKKSFASTKINKLYKDLVISYFGKLLSVFGGIHG